MDAEELLAAVKRNVAELRQSLAKEEAFAAELEARIAPDVPPAATRAPAPVPAPPPSESGLRRLSRQDKTDVVLGMIDERPGRWTVKQARAELKDKGIDPEAGTPIKNILWHIAKDGRGTSLGAGSYDFPPRQRSNGTVSTQEGLRL